MLLAVIGYKLVCVDHTVSKPFKSYIGENAVYNFINSMIEEKNSSAHRDCNINIELNYKIPVVFTT